MQGEQHDVGLDLVLGAMAALQRSARAQMRKVASAKDLRRPGTVLRLPSGREYVVQQDGSWKRRD